MNNQYAAREVNGLWSVATSTEVIANHLSESLAIDALKERTGLVVDHLEPSTPSTFLATMTSALAETSRTLQQGVEQSVEEYRRSIKADSDFVGVEFDKIRKRMKRQELLREIADLRNEYVEEHKRLLVEMEAGRVNKHTAVLCVSNYLDNSDLSSRIAKIKSELEAL